MGHRQDNVRSIQIAYAGKPLTSGKRYIWKVRVWHKAGNVSAWSECATWFMGLLSPKDWQAQWISFKDDTPLESTQTKMVLPAARCYRKPFIASRKVKRATAYATALGIHDLHLNGRRVSDQLFTPGWSDYRIERLPF